MTELKLGNKVKCTKTQKLGTVIEPGPYGDQPFQVKDEHGDVHSFITEYGYSPFTGDCTQCWEKR